MRCNPASIRTSSPVMLLDAGELVRMDAGLHLIT